LAWFEPPHPTITIAALTRHAARRDTASTLRRPDRRHMRGDDASLARSVHPGNPVVVPRTSGALLLSCHASERRRAQASDARSGRRAGALIDTAACRRRRQSLRLESTGRALPSWTTTSSRDAGAAIIATRDCASCRRIARAIAIASLR
jgi:hypothetical protein